MTDNQAKTITRSLVASPYVAAAQRAEQKQQTNRSRHLQYTHPVNSIRSAPQTEGTYYK